MMKVADVLRDESCWTQGNYSIDNEGKVCNPDGEHAAKWCLVGALFKVYGTGFPAVNGAEFNQARLRIVDYIYRRTGEKIITDWNDNPERTFTEIRELIDATGL